MKKILFALAALLFIATASFGQEKPMAKKHHKTTMHKKHRMHKTMHKTHHVAKQNNGDEPKMDPKAGTNKNGAGKTARVQKTTKDRSDNLNDMDKSRN
jgi:hypothetical protein